MRCSSRSASVIPQFWASIRAVPVARVSRVLLCVASPRSKGFAEAASRRRTVSVSDTKGVCSSNTILQELSGADSKTCGTITSSPGMDRLVRLLKREGRFKSPRVEAALLATDRRCFVPDHFPDGAAYLDQPLPIGCDETISAPHMHATCLELLEPSLQPGAAALDVGSGSGFLTAAMAEMVGPNGSVLGIEEHAHLAEHSIRSIHAAAPHLMCEPKPRVTIRAGNALEVLQGSDELYDAIHVGAAAEQLPTLLLDRLKAGGRMVIPVGGEWGHQVLKFFVKDKEGAVFYRDLFAVRYVPLTPPSPTRVATPPRRDGAAAS